MSAETFDLGEIRESIPSAGVTLMSRVWGRLIGRTGVVDGRWDMSLRRWAKWAVILRVDVGGVYWEVVLGAIVPRGRLRRRCITDI